MKPFHFTIPISVVCWALAAHAQLPITETANPSGMQTPRLGNDQDATVLMAAVRKVSELGESDPQYESALYNLAGLYRRQHNYAEAESVYKRALAVSEKVHGAKHGETAALLNELALLFQEQAKFSDARALLQRALAMREQAFGPEHPLTSTVLNNLASVYNNQGQYSEAEVLYKRALTIWENLEPEKLSLAATLDNLASVEEDLGEYSQADRKSVV